LGEANDLFREVKLALRYALVDVRDAFVDEGEASLGIRYFISRTRYFLIGIGELINGIRYWLKPMWNRSKPYEDKVKEKLKWLF